MRNMSRSPNLNAMKFVPPGTKASRDIRATLTPCPLCGGHGEDCKVHFSEKTALPTGDDDFSRNEKKQEAWKRKEKVT